MAERSFGYTVLGIDHDLELSAVINCTPFGTESMALDGHVLPYQATVHEHYEEAARVADRAIRLDARYYPPVNPVMAEVSNRRVVSLLASAAIAPDIKQAGEKHGLTVRVV